MRHQLALVVPPQLFRREPAHSLDEAALDLAHVDRRVQRLADIVQNVDAQQPIFAGQRVHDYFGHRGTVAKIVERHAAPRLAVIADLGCPVKAGGRQRDAREVGELDELVERQRLVAGAHFVRAEDDRFRCYGEVGRCEFGESRFQLACGILRRLAVHVGT